MIKEKNIPPKTKIRILELLAVIDYSLIEVRTLLKAVLEQKEHKKER